MVRGWAARVQGRSKDTNTTFAELTHADCLSTHAAEAAPSSGAGIEAHKASPPDESSVKGAH